MNSNEFKRWLKEQGCTFDEKGGKGGHIKVFYGDRMSILPMHGKKELGTGLVKAIIKQLGIEKNK